jgi:hypothetical protein
MGIADCHHTTRRTMMEDTIDSEAEYKELVALRAEVEDLENKLATGVHTCSNTCKRPMCVLRKERNKLRELMEETCDSIEEGDIEISTDSYTYKAYKAALEKSNE